jgi:hypothetical protein
MYTTPIFPEYGHRLRERPVAPAHYQNAASRQGAPGILPTPDPTIASCISDEDVAMQLIRLGDASNFSHGRNSASTLDDAFSGAADASSTGATSNAEFSDNEEDDELPARSRQRLESSPLLPPGHVKRTHKQLDDILPSYDSTEPSGDEGDDDYRHEDRHDGQIKSEYDEDPLYGQEAHRAKKLKTNATGASVSKSRVPKPMSAKASKNVKNHANTASRKPKPASTTASQKVTAPAQMASPAPLKKPSGGTVNFQHQLGADEEDLSTKPRCQRCRKSKKGCDRQRPCGRCRDAGIGAEGCVSEDEGNGRKGRYGRHMGVPVKKTLEAMTVTNEPPPSGSVVASAPSPLTLADKNKKRKR